MSTQIPSSMALPQARDVSSPEGLSVHTPLVGSRPVASLWRAALASKAGRCAQYVLLPLAVLAIWEWACRAELVRKALLPPASAVAAEVWRLAASGDLWEHLWASILRVLEGYAIAAGLALALGVAIGISSVLARLSDLLIQVLRPIPPIAWIPLAILWFGIGETSKVFIIFLGAFFPIVVNVVDGIRGTDQRYVELAQVLEVSRSKLIRRVVLPGAMPSVMTGLRVGLGSAWVCVVAAELIAAERGIGYLIVDGRELSRPDVVVAGMIIIGVIGKAMDLMLRFAERRLIPWKKQYEGS